MNNADYLTLRLYQEFLPAVQAQENWLGKECIEAGLDLSTYESDVLAQLSDDTLNLESYWQVYFCMLAKEDGWRECRVAVVMILLTLARDAYSKNQVEHAWSLLTRVAGISNATDFFSVGMMDKLHEENVKRAKKGGTAKGEKTRKVMEKGLSLIIGRGMSQTPIDRYTLFRSIEPELLAFIKTEGISLSPFRILFHLEAFYKKDSRMKDAVDQVTLAIQPDNR